MRVYMRPEFFEVSMCFRQVLTIGVFTFIEIRHRIEPKTIHTQFTPEVNDSEYSGLHMLAVVIQVGLVMEETVPVILLRDGIPGPVRTFEILEDDAHVF